MKSPTVIDTLVFIAFLPAAFNAPASRLKKSRRGGGEKQFPLKVSGYIAKPFKGDQLIALTKRIFPLAPKTPVDHEKS